MANVDIELGYKDAAWFTANATRVLKQGQPVFLQQTGQFKIGDGTTQLQNLSFLGGIVQNYTSSNGITKVVNDFELGGNLTQNTVVSGNGSYNLFLGYSGNDYIDLRGTYTELAHSVQNLYNAPLHQFSGTNIEGNITGYHYLNTDNGAGVTPQLYADSNGDWQIGSSTSYASNYGTTTTLFNTGLLIVQGGTVALNGELINNVYFSNNRGIDSVLAGNTLDIGAVNAGLITIGNTGTTNIQGTFNINGASFNSNVIGSVLTGYVSGSGTIGATDTVLSAIEKLNGNIALLTGAVIYQGTWNANTNSPALASGVGTKGYLYKVSVAGTTTIDGISQWNVGDQIVFNGTSWDKIDGVPNEVLSVNGLVGAVPLTGTSNRITVSGTNQFDIDANYAGQSSITTVGTLTSGSTGTGFTLNFGTSTLSGSISTSNTDAKIKGSASISNGIIYQNGTADTVTTNANFTYDGSKLSLTRSAPICAQFTATSSVLNINCSADVTHLVLLNGASIRGYLGASSSNSFHVYNSTAANLNFAVTNLGSLILGNQAVLSTSATDGFVYLPTCAGTPTGTPTSFTGKCAMIYDTTNNKLNIYNGGWKSILLS